MSAVSEVPQLSEVLYVVIDGKKRKRRKRPAKFKVSVVFLGRVSPKRFALKFLKCPRLVPLYL